MLYTSTLRMVEGLGTGAFSTATFALVADLFPESIATTMVRQMQYWVSCIKADVFLISHAHVHEVVVVIPSLIVFF